MLTGSILILSNNLSAQITDPSPYCVASFDGGEFFIPRTITEVKFASMTNTSGSTQFNAPHYVYYNNITAPEVTKGQSYTLTVQTAQDETIHYLAAFIDFNGNNQFELPSEMILSQTIVDGSISNPATITVNIPANAISGTTRMRVIAFLDDEYTWSQNDPSYVACTAYDGGFIDNGETEDYNINITGGSTVGTSTIIASEFRISPNPAKDIIKITDAMKGATIEIISMDGRRLLYTESIQTNTLDISDLPSGTALIRITTNEQVTTQTIAIQ